MRNSEVGLRYYFEKLAYSEFDAVNVPPSYRFFAVNKKVVKSEGRASKTWYSTFTFCYLLLQPGNFHDEIASPAFSTVLSRTLFLPKTFLKCPPPSPVLSPTFTITSRYSAITSLKPSTVCMRFGRIAKVSDEWRFGGEFYGCGWLRVLPSIEQWHTLITELRGLAHITSVTCDTIPVGPEVLEFNA